MSERFFSCYSVLVRRAERVERMERLLRARGTITATELASELEVSARTVHRDLEALRSRGLRIDGDPGRGGGLRLDARSTPTPVRFEADEVVSMWLAAELSRKAGVLPWGRAVTRGLDRIFAALPDTRRRELRALVRRVIVADPASAKVRETLGPVDPELLVVVEEAFTARLGLRFEYVDREGRRSLRIIEPHGLLVQTPLFYVLAVDVEKRAPRMFRMDRIRRARVARDLSFVPDAAVLEELQREPS